MGAVQVTLTQEEETALKYWDDAVKAKVLRNLTLEHANILHYIKRGTVSHKYKNYNFYFYDEDKNEISENIITIALNDKFFKKII